MASFNIEGPDATLVFATIEGLENEIRRLRDENHALRYPQQVDDELLRAAEELGIDTSSGL